MKYILTLKTDGPVAEIGLFDEGKILDYLKYEHENELSENLLIETEKLLSKNKLNFQNLSGINVFKGPGSFTGLRIGISQANALSYSLSIPIVSGKSKNWIKEGNKSLIGGKDQKTVIPYYGSLPHITNPKK